MAGDALSVSPMYLHLTATVSLPWSAVCVRNTLPNVYRPSFLLSVCVLKLQANPLLNHSLTTPRPIDPNSEAATRTDEVRCSCISLLGRAERHGLDLYVRASGSLCVRLAATGQGDGRYVWSR